MPLLLRDIFRRNVNSLQIFVAHKLFNALCVVLLLVEFKIVLLISGGIHCA